jgi:phospholipase C
MVIARIRNGQHARRVRQVFMAGAVASTIAFVGLVPLPIEASGTTIPPVSDAGQSPAALTADIPTTTPIKHLVVIIGENHTFDNVFATYQPPPGQHVQNLLSEGIVNANGSPGPDVGLAEQKTAQDTSAQGYQVAPATTGKFAALPQPNTTYASQACTGVTPGQPDSRFPAHLPNAPYQITKYAPYLDSHTEYSGTCQFNGAVVGDPLHRFYQMYQEVSGGANDLWTWVHQTAGDSNGAPPTGTIGPNNNNNNTGQGALDMGFYNMAQGDAPVLNFLARNYAISDDYHQAVMGGTGANHIALGTGDAAYYQDASGKATPPPSGEVENPNAQPGTNNFYTQDGYGQSGTTNGGSYSECANPTEPGVAGVDAYLGTLAYKTFHGGDCAPGHYYLLNNYNPGYNVDGSINTSTFSVPPQHQANWTIADALQAKHISWGYYGEDYASFAAGDPNSGYCNICDPFAYASSIMTNPTTRAKTQHGLDDFDAAVANGTLPAVSFLKPADDDGHPGYSTLAAFEGFVTNAIDRLQNNPTMWRSTAVFVTFDEGGGYYDSGQIQPISYFGDGTRVPMIVVSPYTPPGYVDHTYTDHVSILKFIEANWGLAPLSTRSLDNLPNPIQRPGSYLPQNPPAIGNMMSFFNFANQQRSVASPVAPAAMPVPSAENPGNPLHSAVLPSNSTR